LIVTSTAYRQSAHADAKAVAEGAKSDPDNRLLWHARLRRLEAEAVRDALLAVSGHLKRQVGGPFVPLEGRPDGTVVVAQHPDPEGAKRRSLYLYARRNFNLSLLAVFDQPLMLTNCTSRQQSVAVPQALTLLNDASVNEAATHLAQRATSSAASTTDRIRIAFQLALIRQPSADEATAAAELLTKHAKRYADLPSEQAALRALSHLCHVLLCTNEFLYIE
jgi:hypothetical protein